MVMVIKRNGNIVPFEKQKIEIAITKAIESLKIVDELNLASEIAYRIWFNFKIMEDEGKNENINIEDIQNLVEKMLMTSHINYASDVAREYIRYRYVRELNRKDDKRVGNIMSVISNTNKTLKTENSNKDMTLLSTARDYVAGEVSKEICRDVILPQDVVEAHDKGIIHFHDMDYSFMPLFNCCLVNIGDMLDNGTVINKTMIDSPKTFSTACNIMTQIIQQISSGQYGGQTMNVKHLGKYLKRTYDKQYKKQSLKYDEATAKELAKSLMMEDLERGVQMIQYQINTISSTNGQTPFTTLFLELDPKDEYIEYTALIIEEILKQRIKGVKNEVGVYIPPTFPKLVYLLDEDNCLKGGRYDYLTELASECTSKNMYPDYISAKVMRESHDGIVPPMGKLLLI